MGHPESVMIARGFSRCRAPNTESDDDADLGFYDVGRRRGQFFARKVTSPKTASSGCRFDCRENNCGYLAQLPCQRDATRRQGVRWE